MGEITLDSKPRRGRKPKKADICHLIYKNYGTVLPKRINSSNSNSDSTRISSPSSLSINMAINATKVEESKNVPNTGDFPDLSVDSKTSLLEKQLLYLSNPRNNECPTPRSESVWSNYMNESQDEPLNLCIRDIERKNKSSSNVESNNVVIKVEPSSDTDEEVINESQGKFNNVPKLDIVNKSEINIKSKASSPDCSSDASYGLGSPVPGGYVYWPSAGVFVHPMALQSHFLYYQKLGTPLTSVPSPEQLARFGNLGVQIPSSNVSSTSTSNLPPIGCLPKSQTNKKSGVKILPNIAPKPSEGKLDLPQKKNNVPIKRKRSAIFIPPAENPTEVSICKFKFTGGAKPSLEEKKMLSVDAGGNFRYYSGTGDKSMRGYEFFPREALQLSSTGNSEKTSVGVSGTSTDTKEDSSCVQGETKDSVRLLIPPEQSVSKYDRDSSPSSSVMWKPSCVGSSAGETSERAEFEKRPKRKRRTRKSIMREKLEQTFKEKGFLIQTQQLESAEGATYCKFRQLRKFTRYLFRSWKDYLPGNIQEISGSDTSLTPSPQDEGDPNTQASTPT